ncbi:VOC family protein [Ravibacter arvi]|uniref:VOC family protein n=1 Tax=Ravibacter arvi TaxID=2051041 RepID=A0ABP8M0I4_9BACT
MENRPVVWFEIYVDDMERATSFYEKVLNVKLTQMSDPTDQDESMIMRGFPASMESHGSGGALVKVEWLKAGGNSSVVYFECEDCAVEESRVVAAGGKVQQSKMSLGEFGFCTIFTDTEGNMVGLHSMK